MIYELRHYDTHSDRALDALTRRFASDTLRIWGRIGIEPVGFWSVIIGANAPRLTYLLAWDTLAQRETLWEAFLTDDEWRVARTKSIKDAGGDPVREVTSSILRPVPETHIPHKSNQPTRLAGGVFELRTYGFREASHLAQMQEWLARESQPLMERHGMFTMGLWTTIIGVSPRLTQMLVFENLAHRERAWAAFYTDPEWPTLERGLYPGGQALIASTESVLMKGTEFSGWR